MDTTAKRLALILLAMIAVLTGCSGQIGDYMAASSVSRQGFAGDTDAIRQLHGQEANLWAMSTTAGHAESVRTGVERRQFR